MQDKCIFYLNKDKFIFYLFVEYYGKFKATRKRGEVLLMSTG